MVAWLDVQAAQQLQLRQARHPLVPLPCQWPPLKAPQLPPSNPAAPLLTQHLPLPTPQARTQARNPFRVCAPARHSVTTAASWLQNAGACGHCGKPLGPVCAWRTLLNVRGGSTQWGEDEQTTLIRRRSGKRTCMASQVGVARRQYRQQ